MSAADLLIRPACADDAAAMVEIYRPHVEETCVSFELVAPTVEEFAQRVHKAQQRHDWLVAEADGAVLQVLLFPPSLLLNCSERGAPDSSSR